MNNTIKVVIFDFGGVLTLPQDPDSVYRLQALCRLPPERFANEYRRHRPDFDGGYISAEIYWTRVLAAGGVTPRGDLITRLLREDILGWSRINDRVLGWSQDLRARGYRTAVLSNMPEEIRQYLLNTFLWLQEFELLIFSSAVRKVKPQAPIYQECLSRLHALPEQCLFIDDNEENIHTAQGMGIKGLWFKNMEQAQLALKRYFPWWTPVES